MPASPATLPNQIETTLGAYLDILERAGVPVEAAGAPRELPITHVSCNSLDTVPGTLFICKGATFKVDYLRDARATGAVAYVAEAPFAGIDTPCIATPDVRRAMGHIADAAWDHPSGKIAICAFTGTKGKTTSSYCLHAVLDARARRTGEPRCPLFSTIVLDDGITAAPSALTTPEPLDLERHLAYAASTGASALVMEASSQALKYGRMIGVELAVGAFTNISPDHVSPIEHPTFEDYFASKLRIFEHARTAVVNLDMRPELLGQVLGAAGRCERILTFSRRDAAADVTARDIRHEAGGIAFTLATPAGTEPARLSLMGTYNVENALAATACALAIGATLDDVLEGLAQVSVPGRMEVAYADDSLAVIVDYAHNGGSLEALLTDIRAAYPERELTCVFGATGTKGVERRFGMGKVAGTLADRIVATTDDPGTEDAGGICTAIIDSATAAGATDTTCILDREEAIAHAIDHAHRPAVVVLAGKGHEQFMIRAEGRVPYEGDAAVVRRIMRTRG